jgi:hypothetical protein
VWRELLGVAFGLMIAAWLGSFLLRRWFPRAASGLGIAGALLGRVAVGAVFLAIGVQAAERGGYWLLVTVLFSVLGILSFGLAGLTLFVLRRGVTE